MATRQIVSLPLRILPAILRRPNELSTAHHKAVGEDAFICLAGREQGARPLASTGGRSRFIVEKADAFV